MLSFVANNKDFIKKKITNVAHSFLRELIVNII